LNIRKNRFSGWEETLELRDLGMIFNSVNIDLKVEERKKEQTEIREDCNGLIFSFLIVKG